MGIIDILSNLGGKMRERKQNPKRYVCTQCGHDKFFLRKNHRKCMKCKHKVYF